MRMTWNSGLVVVLASASIAVACDRNGNDRAADDRGSSPQVSLTGCVEAAPGTNQYVLRNVHMTDASQPSGVVTDGSWVKLRADNGDRTLRDHIGRMVAVTGTITDTGRDTIGTSGQAHAPDEAEPRTDASRAAGGEHHSKKVAGEAGPIGQQSLTNSTAPEIAVQRVSGTGSPCPGR